MEWILLEAGVALFLGSAGAAHAQVHITPSASATLVSPAPGVYGPAPFAMNFSSSNSVSFATSPNAVASVTYYMHLENIDGGFTDVIDKDDGTGPRSANANGVWSRPAHNNGALSGGRMLGTAGYTAKAWSQLFNNNFPTENAGPVSNSNYYSVQ